ncbi:MAG: cobalamin B12-binding domain-containing protein [Myxococcota bacterium]
MVTPPPSDEQSNDDAPEPATDPVAAGEISGVHEAKHAHEAKILAPIRVDEDQLKAVVEKHVLPRLLRNHPPMKLAEPTPDPTQVQALADIASSDDLPQALAFVDDLMVKGLGLEGALLELVAPAARLLGEQWHEDVRSFTDVTFGLGTLHRLVSRLDERGERAGTPRGAVLLRTRPGEQHTLAVAILAAILRADGWDAELALGWRDEALIAEVARAPYHVVGLANPKGGELREHARLIERLRRHSARQPVLVVLGGAQALAEHAPALGAVYCGSARELRAMLRGLPAS